MTSPPITFPQELRTMTMAERILFVIGDLLLVPASFASGTKAVTAGMRFWIAGEFVGVTGSAVWLLVTAFLLFMALAGLDMQLKRVRLEPERVIIRGLYRRSFKWEDVRTAVVEIGFSKNLIIRTNRGKRFEIGAGDRGAFETLCQIAQHFAPKPPLDPPTQ